MNPRSLLAALIFIVLLVLVGCEDPELGDYSYQGYQIGVNAMNGQEVAVAWFENIKTGQKEILFITNPRIPRSEIQKSLKNLKVGSKMKKYGIPGGVEFRLDKVDKG